MHAMQAMVSPAEYNHGDEVLETTGKSSAVTIVRAESLPRVVIRHESSARGWYL